jgi:hypothetical protein
MNEISEDRAAERPSRVLALHRQVIYCRDEAQALGLKLAHVLLDVAGAELATVRGLELRTAAEETARPVVSQSNGASAEPLL